MQSSILPRNLFLRSFNLIYFYVRPLHAGRFLLFFPVPYGEAAGLDTCFTSVTVKYDMEHHKQVSINGPHHSEVFAVELELK